MSTLLYSRVNCGLRSVVTILEVINESFDGILGSVPNYNTIENWVKKCGLKVYTASGDFLADKEYAQITDESMMIGSEKLLLTLGVPAEHQGRALQYDDVQVLDIAIAGSWSGEKIGKQLRSAAEKTGHSPQYVISDNASIMRKGVCCAGMKHHHDISHSLGMFLERAYKEEPDFKDYLNSMTNAKFKHSMTKIAYLLPPTQRTVARFLNLSEWVAWSRKMSKIFYTLNSEEREVFSFIPANASLIDELAEVMSCIEGIEHRFKHQGFSQTNVLHCLRLVEKILLSGNSRMIKIGNSIKQFLHDEAELLESDQDVHNNSSDIIESIFGTIKKRKSPNKLYGITPFILFAPIHIHLIQTERAKDFDFKQALEDIKLSQIQEWAGQNLSTNLVSKRIQRLNMAG